MIVLKFGGSSVDRAEALAWVAEVVRGRLPRRPTVVISAMGKTTRRLLGAAEAAARGELDAALGEVEELESFHRREGREALPAAARGALDAALDPWFRELRERLAAIAAVTAARGTGGELSPRDSDAVAGCGELLSSTILAHVLPAHGVPAAWVDARRAVVTDAAFTRARPLEGATDARLREALLPAIARGEVPVVGGYIGATEDGVPTTLGKEGSDFSAALVGAALSAEEVQILTDVPGMLTADPRLFPGARRVRSLSFAEGLELAWSGAKKPHHGTLGPAARAGVPIRIVGSRDPDAEGTLIGRRAAGAGPTVKSIACRANACLLPLRAAADAAEADGFLPAVWELCRRLRPALLVVAAGPDGAELALDREDRLAEARQGLAEAGGACGGSFEVHPGRAVVSIVSEDLASPAFARQALDAARAWGPRLVLPETGAAVACPSVRLLVDEAALPEVVARLHERLLPGSPQEVVE